MRDDPTPHDLTTPRNNPGRLVIHDLPLRAQRLAAALRAEGCRVSRTTNRELAANLRCSVRTVQRAFGDLTRAGHGRRLPGAYRRGNTPLPGLWIWEKNEELSPLDLMHTPPLPDAAQRAKRRGARFALVVYAVANMTDSELREYRYACAHMRWRATRQLRYWIICERLAICAMRDRGIPAHADIAARIARTGR